jgi:hypothetical protein
MSGNLMFFEKISEDKSYGFSYSESKSPDFTSIEALPVLCGP